MNTKIGKLGFIGAGNMATAMVKGLIMSRLYTPDRLLASDPDESKIKAITGSFGLKGGSDNRALVRDSSIIILAVKPQVIREVLDGVKEEIRKDHLVISIAAGIPIQIIHSIIGADIPVVRVMPNTPALIQKGISALAPGKTVTQEHVETTRNIFNAIGETVLVQEEMMNAVTALSGSGPGFLFRIMECFVEAGEEIGFDNETSRRLVIQTFLGATQLAGESGKTLSELRKMVTSPGGTTEAGLAVFEDRGLGAGIREVVEAAYHRGVELGKKG